MSDTPVYQLETQSAILQRMINYFQGAQTDITDFNQGSEILNLLTSVSLTNYEIRYLIDYLLQMGYVQTAAGDWLDELGIIVNVIRNPAVQATGSLVISIPAAVSYDIDIPDGTLITCSTDNTLYFQTVGDQTFTAGSTTLNLTGIATVGGADGNVAPGIINEFYTPVDALTVTNPTAFENGMDVEDDTSLRNRILAAGQGNITGSVSWYQSQAESVEGVHDVGVINNPPIPGVDVELIVNGNIQPTQSSVIEAVQNLFAQPDHAIGGVNVLVVAPSFITENIAAIITLMPGADWDTVSATLEADIQCYFQGGTTSYGVDYPGLDVGVGFTYLVLQMVFANSMGSNFIDFNISSPSADADITDTQAIQLGTINLTQSS